MMKNLTRDKKKCCASEKTDPVIGLPFSATQLIQRFWAKVLTINLKLYERENYGKVKLNNYARGCWNVLIL